MDVKSLPREVRSLLRSGMNMNNLSHCVQELIFNSLDAKSTAIAVRVNLKNFRIQVVDNGRGISKLDMSFIGLRHMTSKCQTLQDLKKRTKYYGYRGESLANIASVSEKLTITSKLIDGDCTYSKVIENKKFSDVVEVKQRPEHGTTVTVENFLYNIPVRQKSIKSEQAIEDVKNCVEFLIVIHPQVSFSLRNDVNLKVVLKVNKSNSVLESFTGLHPEICVEDLAMCEVSKGSVSISGLVYKKSHTSKHLQLIYVNKRPVLCSRIYNLVKSFYRQARNQKVEFLQSNDYPVYVINITSPYLEVDFTYNSAKMNVEFKNWDLVVKCVQKLFCKEWGLTKEKEIKKKVDVISNMGAISISNLPNVVKTKPIKRKMVDNEEQQDLMVKRKKRNFFLADDLKENSSLETAASSNMNMRVYSYKNQEEKGVKSQNSNQIDLQDQEQGKKLIMDYFFKSAEVCADFNENPSEKQSCSSNDESVIDCNTREQKPPEEKEKRDFCTALSTITFNNIAKKKRAERLNNVYYAKHFEDEKKFASKAVQTDPVIILEPKFDEINTFHYYLPEEQGWAENFGPNISENFLPNDKEPKSSCFFKSKNTSDIYLNVPAADDITFFKPEKSKNLDNSIPLLPPPDARKESHDKLFTLENIAISPKKQKLRSDNNFHRCQTMPPQRIPTDENVRHWKSLETIKSPCKLSFEELFKTEKSEFFIIKPGLLGGKENYQQTNTNEEATRKTTQTLLFSIQSNDKEMLLRSDLDLEEEQYRRRNERTQECSGKTFKTHEAETFSLEKNVFQNVQNNLFKFKPRLDLLPKGCSPIMSAFSKVDKILSPNSKEYLEKTILQSFDDDLQTTKWQNFLKNSDFNSLLNEIYQEKARVFEKAIPKALLPPIEETFSRDIFDKLALLAQVDKKFIAAVDRKRRLLYFFDQHAVDERIRVEMLFKEYRQDKKYQSVPKYVSSHYKRKISLDLNIFDVEILRTYKTGFNDVGVDFHILGNTIEILKVPLCFINKAERSPHNSKTLECLVKGLVLEVVQTLKSTRGCLVSTPRIITDVINSEACRGAIKFGDFLTHEEMQRLLSGLSRCNLPFQCAHGRPTLTPVVSLQEQVEETSQPNLKNLYRTY